MAERVGKGIPGRTQFEQGRPFVSRSGRGSGERGLVGGQARVARVTLVGDQLVPGSLVLSQSFQVAREAGPLTHHHNLPTDLRRK